MQTKVYVIPYHHIDIYDGIHPPGTFHQSYLPCTEEKARQAFLAAGWEGDGDLGLIWVPPFMVRGDTIGVVLWHVKQGNNGTSWLCADKPYAFAGFDPEWNMAEWMEHCSS